MKHPLFSIIIPIYNTEKYLRRCVDSACCQTYENIEIILVDDGSPDECPKICDEYAALDERIKVVHKSNGGLSDARNAGMRIAEGEYVIFLDSDDTLFANACEELHPYAETGCDLIAGGCVSGGERSFFNSGITAVGIYDAREYLKLSFTSGRMPMAVWLYVYKRSFLVKKKLEFMSGIFHEDEEFTPRVFLSANLVVFSGVCFYNYSVREGSITRGQDMRKNADDLYAVCQRLRTLYSRLSDRKLKRLAIDSLAVKYLSLFQDGRLYQYGKEYIRRKFIVVCTRRIRTAAKASLYCISPKIYWIVNRICKNT